MTPGSETPVLLLCGGSGRRAYPFSEFFPKPLMPINGKPLLMHQMEIYAFQGFRRFILSVGFRKESIVDYFNHRSLGWNIEIVDTGNDADTGDRILRCRELLNGRFCASYADSLANVDLKALIEQHRLSNASATLTVVQPRLQYGLLEIDEDGVVNGFDEKPLLLDSWVSSGYFVFERRVFEHWIGSSLERDILPRLAQLRSLHAYKHHGFFVSVDNCKDRDDLERVCSGGRSPWLQTISL